LQAPAKGPKLADMSHTLIDLGVARQIGSYSPG
jgi:hypothetical protein